MLSIPNLAPICRNLNSRIESFKYGKFRVSKTYLGPCIRHYETWNSLRAPNYEAFLKILINLRTRSFSSDNLPQKLVKAGAAIKWRGYWSECSLCKCCSSSTLPRQQRRLLTIFASVAPPQFCCEHAAWIASFNVPLNTIVGSKSLHL